MEDMSTLSSLKGEAKPEDYVQPHYKEAYRLAIDRLVKGGRAEYEEFLKGERVGGFLSEEELLFIAENTEQPAPANPPPEEENGDGPPADDKSSTGTYWPMQSDVETPDLDLGWPEVMHERLQTNVELLFHPPRQNNLTIKEVIRKHIQDARQVVAIVMDIFTDVDIFKETVDAAIRGVPVYILLDDSHLKRFLTMAENLDIKIHTLRNMRVRTVKGQEYLCRSGAKFHGAMEQKFLVVDCHTVVYGSYSFMWSYEKINLSMVQVITGHLVQSYDEEFRTLYARSTVPTVLSPPEGVLQDNKMNGRLVLPKYVPQSAHHFERKDELRHTLDAVYRKTCEKRMSVRDVEEMLYEEEPIRNVPSANYGMGAPNRMPQYQPPVDTHFLKRHSYAGERQEALYTPQNMRYRASNWNVSGDAAFCNGRNMYPLVADNYLQAPQMYRGRNARQSYHGIDKQVLTTQQNMPTLENTSKAFLRTWRIESYLNNPEAPVGDSHDYIDQYEAPDNKANYYMQARMRASFVFQSTIPEQQETNSGTNNSTPSQVDPAAVPSATPHYQSTQWNATAAVIENRARNEEFMLKRRSLQILDDPRNNTGYVSGRNGHNSVYASLSRATGGQFVKPKDIDDWNKRHSVADPRSDYRDDCEPSNPVYGGAFARRQSGGFNVQNGGYGSNISEDQRSVSHYDVCATKEAKIPPRPSWQEPPSRTVSAAALDANGKESRNSTGDCAPCYLKKSTRKIRSLLNIPEKKEASSRSQKLDSSTETIRAEDDEQKSAVGSTSNSVRIPLGHQRNPPVVAVGKPSAPRFSTEELQPNPPTAAAPRGTQQQYARGNRNDRSSLAAGNWRKDGEGDSRIYSRFEPFCSLENQPSRPATGSASIPAQEKTRNLLLPKSEHLGRGSIGHPDNKLGRFIQRVGNLIHKNK